MRKFIKLITGKIEWVMSSVSKVFSMDVLTYLFPVIRRMFVLKRGCHEGYYFSLVLRSFELFKVSILLLLSFFAQL